MSGRRVVAALLAMMLGAAVISVLPGSLPASAAPADGASSDSAVTVHGAGDFKDLKVTVSQTRNIINQVVTITWQGGTPTLPGNGQYSTNYLQIMQCWGDDTAGPDRTQCQFGATNVLVGGGGDFVGSRTLDSRVVDPGEKLKLPAGSPDVFGTAVPFWPVGSPKPTDAVAAGQTSDFFDQHTTNEIPLAQTTADGTGQQFFEVQTIRQAPGLGCGETITTGGATTGRKCWLVVVPRGGKEVDGTPRSGGPDPFSRLNSSPLSQSNWDHRVVFPLEFVPVNQACPLGAAERPVVGNELAVEAVTRWQPVLCAGGALYSYTQVPDDIARNLVSGGPSPRLALMTNPVPADQAPPDHPLVYAPVALSGLAIAFNIERHLDPRDASADPQLNARRFMSMKLTPRLVAKLLTQSYQRSVAGFDANHHVPDYLKSNPDGLTGDPEFLALNSDYKGYTVGIQPADGMAQLGSSDLTSLLWSWVKADPDASDFLAGKPDKFGMVVNPYNKGLTLPTSTFPRNDQSCADYAFTATLITKSCTLDRHPFFNDMHAAALLASRGDTGAQIPTQDGAKVNPDGTPVTVLAKDVRQAPGARALVAVVDAATAVRYGLPTASLLNTAHQFVAPTTASLRAGAAAMKPSAVPGVLAADPGATDPAAYPLTALSYAVTAPSALDAPAGKDYAALVRYAAGPGQQPGELPGQLPFGMAPLPDPLRAQAIAAAAIIESQAGRTPSGRPVPGTTSPVVPGITAGGAAGGPSTAVSPGGTTTGPGGGVGSPPPGPAGNPRGSPAQSPGVAARPAGALRRTPSVPAPAWVGALLLVILICGALAATSSPVLHSTVLRRLGAAPWRRVRKEVMRTER